MFGQDISDSWLLVEFWFLGLSSSLSFFIILRVPDSRAIEQGLGF